MALDYGGRGVQEDTGADAGLTDADIYAFIVSNMGNPKAVADYAKTNSLTLSDLARISTYPVDTVKAFLGADAAGIDTNPSKTIKIAGQSYKIDTGTVDNVYKQIAAQGLMSQWKGEGFGSAEKNARRMAEELVASGITDIKQVGQGTIVVPAYQQYEGGDAGNLVDYPESSYTTLINKTTGKPLLSDYDRSGGNVFSGTFAGAGNIAYRVQMGSDGIPYFFTTPDTSNTLAGILKDLGPIGNIAIAIATGGLSIPQQIAAKFAIDMLSGVDPGAALKKAAISYAGAAIPSMDFMKDANKYLTGIDATGSLSKVFTGAAVGATTGLLSGQDLLTAAFNGAKSGGTGAVTDVIMNNMDLSGLTKNQIAALKTTITGTISGKPLDQTLMNAVTGLASSEAQQAIADNKKYAPLDKADADELVGGEKAAYEADGTRGLLQFRRDMKNLSTLTNSGLTGDSMGGDTTSTSGTNTSDASNLPGSTGGINLAAAGTGTASDAGNGVFKVEATGTPIYAEDSRAAALEVPFGYRILSATEEKPTGAFYDFTTNAWLGPTADLTTNAQVNADLALFNGAIGDLDAFAKTTPSTEDDEVAAFLRSIGIYSVDDISETLSNQDILDNINANDFLNPDGSLKTTKTTSSTDTLTVTGTPDTVTTGTDVITTGTGTNTKTTDDKGTVNVVACLPGKVRNAAGNCVDIDCGTGKHWDPITNGCALDAVIPPVEVKCGTNEEKNAAGICVVKCAPGFERGPDGMTCVLKPCGEGYVRGNDGITCVKKPDDTLVCQPNEKLSADGKSCIANVVVEACGPGKERHPNGKDCIDICQPGYVRGTDGITCVKETTEPPACLPGYIRGPDGISCVKDETVEIKTCFEGFVRNAAGDCVPIDCGTGKHWDTITKKCELDAVIPPVEVKCGTNEEKNAAGICVVKCAPGFVRGPDGMTCVKEDDKVVITACGPGKERHPNGKDCIDICQPGYVRGTDGITCIKKDETVICGVNEEKNALGICVAKCAPGFKRGSDGVSCVKDDTVVIEACLPGKELGPDGKTCIDKCKPGYVRGTDGITCVVAPVICGINEEKNAAGICVPKCATGFKRGSDGVSCVKDDTVEIKACLPGKVRDAKGDCVPINCGIGRHYDPILDKCVDDTKIVDKTCLLPNQHWDETQGKCVDNAVDKTCSLPNQHWDEAQGKCVDNTTKVAPPVTTTTTTPVTNVTNVFSSPGGAAPVDTTAPIYAKGMSDFDFFATMEDLLGEKRAKKDTQQDQQDTKMATGGYLDNLLAEQITVDDLLKLLR